METTLPGWLSERYHVEQDGEATVIRYGPQPTAGVKWRSDCPACVTYFSGQSGFFPNHGTLPSCQSGGHPHCTCDSCF